MKYIDLIDLNLINLEEKKSLKKLLLHFKQEKNNYKGINDIILGRLKGKQTKFKF
jgi:hypothetical protein